LTPSGLGRLKFRFAAHQSYPLLPTQSPSSAGGCAQPRRSGNRETMDRTGQAHLLEALLQGLAASVKPNSDIVQGGAEADRNSVARFIEQVGSPDDLRIFRLERGQQLIKAFADSTLYVARGIRSDVLDLRLIYRGLPPALSDRAALMIGDRRHEDPPQPASYRSDVAQLGSAFECTERKALQDLFGFVQVAQALSEVGEETLSRFDERTPERRVGAIDGIGFIIGHCMVVTLIAHL
jgi:hypothetical protein